MKHLTVLMLLASVSSLAAETNVQGLSVEQAVNEGRTHSPKVQRAQAVSEESTWRQKESLSGFLPRISLSAQHFFATKYELLDLDFGGRPVEIAQIYPTTDLSLNATIPVFDGFQAFNRFDAAKQDHEAAELDQQWAELQVEEDIRLKYFQALAARKLQDVTNQNVKTLEDHLKQTQTLRQGGAATNYDVLRVEVQLHEAQTEALGAADNVVLARARLAEAMGSDSDDRSLSGDLPAPDANRIRAVLLPNLSARADIQALSDQTSAADYSEKAAGAYLVPKISLGAQYIIYNNFSSSITNTDQFRSAYNFGLFLNWNLFDGMASYARSHEATLQKLEIEKTLEAAKLHAPRDFDFWKRRYLYNTALFEAKSSDAEKAEESVRLAREGFRAGARTSTEILDAELDLFRARAGIVNALMSMAEAHINLELASGRKL